MDPFEEIGIAEKNAEQHRRSATEKEVRAFFFTFFFFSFLFYQERLKCLFHLPSVWKMLMIKRTGVLKRINCFVFLCCLVMRLLF